ncbi:ABC transporter permease [Telmatocola sphagniphila]|uniref:Transport permease protein n=1 Tax=Telmatocola sphagniphila TaxID=1123043 RepID=A0A8E6B6F1_9BACT|nr:ABC transporter permease [Telmatocola sphagniphila]QVL32955.1 ABC transporter permease [Telmatocola sphagniphila]
MQPMRTQVSTIWQFRHFWMSLVRLDLRLRYRRSVLGIGWSLLNPILMTVVFCVVFNKMLDRHDWKVAAPRYLAALTIWEFISVSTLTACQTFFRNEAYIRQCPLPLVIYTLRSVLGATIHFLIAIVVTIGSIVLLTPDQWKSPIYTFWAVLPSLILLFIFCWAISVIAAFLNVMFQDTQQLAEVFFRIFFFLTPIMYETSDMRKQGLDLIADYSPAVIFIELIRTPLCTGVLPDLMLYGKAMVAVALFSAIALTMISKLEKKLIFHL